jgi:hypothetical protein
MRFSSSVLLLALLIISSCKRSERFSEIPAISFVSLEPNIVQAGSGEDTVFIVLRITDGDADLSGKDSAEVYLLDSRAADTPNINITDVSDTIIYPFPAIPQNAIIPERGIEGYVQVKLNATLLLMRDTISTRTNDTLKFKMYVYDKKRNKSNELITPEIYLVK